MTVPVKFCFIIICLSWLWPLLVSGASGSGIQGLFPTSGHPLKEFESIQRDEFCENNAVGSPECHRFNKHHLKFYFSLFAVVAWGGVVRTIIKTFQLSIPYTVVLLITGLLLGLGARINPACEIWVTFTKFARTPPELILYIFLPLLIFESAFSMKHHVFMTNFLSISIVSLPGMILTTVFTMIGCRQFMSSYGWTLAQAGLFGAIISATDPVAVVAILKDLGTSENLSVMIEGESLLNDGVAILIYEILKEQVDNPDEEANSTVHVISKFLQIAVGGPTFGYMMGKVTIGCLTRVWNDAATEITITFVAAYLTYFIGEFYLGVSGVMAVVLLGVTVNAGSTSISQEVTHIMHLFWDMMAFLANTVLFVLLGIVISETAVNSFDTQDGINLIWLYFALNIIRLTMLLLLCPLLYRAGYETSWTNVVVMMWGGLRGAVGICLALEVFKSKKICQFLNVGPKFLLHTAGIVCFTLLINGTTTKALLDYLGVTTLSSGKLHDMAHAVKTLTAARVRTILALKNDRFLTDCNWDVVNLFTHLKDPYAKHHELHRRAKGDADEETAKATAVPVGDGQPLMLLTHADGTSSSHDLEQQTASPPPPPPPSQPQPPQHDQRQGSQIFRTASGSLSFSDHSSDEDEIEAETPEFNKLMEESRSRVLKSMRISCWTNYEKGGFTEQSVKVLVNSIEKKEDDVLSMITVDDVRCHWEIKGITGWLKKLLNTLLDDEIRLPPKPRNKCRRPFYWVTTQCWFDAFIYFAILANLLPIIFDIVLIIQDRDAKPGLEEKFLLYSTIIFTVIYALECIFKIIGRGVKDYCESRWNLMDFFVLIFSLIETGIAVLQSSQNTGTGNVTKRTELGLLKIVRIVRFVRLLRWAKPILPLLTKLISQGVNNQIFLGLDVAHGYIQALEDAIRLLPSIITHPLIYRKFRILLDKDRLATMKELLILEMENPGVAVAVRTHKASRTICSYMKEELETMHMEGLLEENEYDILKGKVNGIFKKLWVAPSKMKQIHVSGLLERVPWAGGHTDVMPFFQNNNTARTYAPGDQVWAVGDPAAGLILIVHGIVKLEYNPSSELLKTLMDHGVFPNTEFLSDLSFATSQAQYYGTGAILGEYGCLTGIPRAASITAETEVDVIYWTKEEVESALRHFDDPLDSLEARLWRSWGIRLGAEFLRSTVHYATWSGDKIRAHLEQGVVPVDPSLMPLEIPVYICETILIFGQIVNKEGVELTAPALIPEDWKIVYPKPDAPVKPRILLVPASEEIDTIYESSSQTQLQKVILNAPGVYLGLKEQGSDMDLFSTASGSRSINFGARDAKKSGTSSWGQRSRSRRFSGQSRPSIGRKKTSASVAQRLPGISKWRLRNRKNEDPDEDEH